ncbi:MAG: hypothetical protein IT293_19700 [Deltaproteobacteria bacterium]|nr:hypothetical protein [Deltaproteobacteria bacterium]
MRLAQVAAFERIVVLVIAAEYWCRGLARWQDLSPAYVASLGAATLLCLAALLTRWRRPALLVLGLVHAFVVWREFPAAGNHAYLEVMLCLLGAFLDPRDEVERTLYVATARWLAVVIFFFSGVQKLAHGYYFHAEYFGFSLWIESFRTLFRWLLPADEYARLTAFTGAPGDGPYFVRSPLVVAVSNLTWIAEIALPAALLWRPTRPFAVAAAVALIFAIELAAREVFFGLLYVNLILLFLESDLHQRLVAPVALVLASLVAVRAGWLPALVFY